MKILSIHAHFDDFEFVGLGTFELFRQKHGDCCEMKAIICTDGKAGHHLRSREETGAIRLKEQAQSAKLGDFEFELLTLPDGTSPREGALQTDSNLLAALWKTIREFEPDYLFCPPIITDPLLGIHNDHQVVAEAVRKIAYMINVPHCFTPEYPDQELQSKWIKTPVIINYFDEYQKGSITYDFAIDIESVFDLIVACSYCHSSQIKEWLPWVGAHDLKVPADEADWHSTLNDKYFSRSQKLDLIPEKLLEAFTLTSWGNVPTFEQLLEDFPKAIIFNKNEQALKEKLDSWRQ
ncbi:PIG-L family deacetylase [Lentisphaera profundi]|uniref:PIG-L family deacetylase n=1 Tax=Lentisphaera profundi TaxID=1658616 RepID=A0ABY7VRD4_9BACT|nr:PIG-L family deacetylase [Lentisphaera profundi]WDE95783.1 PIG-L family deacetylase [Lentisphaera profundi]